jgi:hypothetical protein
MYSGNASTDFANSTAITAIKQAIQTNKQTAPKFGGSRIGSSKNTQKRRPKKQRQSGKGKSKRV